VKNSVLIRGKIPGFPPPKRGSRQRGQGGNVGDRSHKGETAIARPRCSTTNFLTATTIIYAVGGRNRCRPFFAPLTQPYLWLASLAFCASFFTVSGASAPRKSWMSRTSIRLSFAQNVGRPSAWFLQFVPVNRRNQEPLYLVQHQKLPKSYARFLT
jgi:hypothetical protein